jgi:NitT/TauT family transport system substrate-binding protein
MCIEHNCSEAVISNFRHRATIVAITLLSLAGANACERQPLPRPAAMTLEIAVNVSYLGSGLLYLAEARGYFAAEDLKVNFLPRDSGRDAMQALLDGQADLATVANTPLMFAIARDQPIAIVATIFQGESTHGILIRNDRNIDRIEQLTGRVVGVPLGTDGHYALGVILADHGVRLEQLHLADLGPVEMAQALRTGAVDAIAAWEPWLGRAAEEAEPGRPYARIMSPRGFPHAFHLAGAPEGIARDQDALRALLRALRRAQIAAEQDPERVLAELAAVMAMDGDALRADTTRYRFIVQLSQGLLTMLEDQARWAQRNGLLDPGPLPDFLSHIHLEALLAVDPYAVTLVQ